MQDFWNKVKHLETEVDKKNNYEFIVDEMKQTKRNMKPYDKFVGNFSLIILFVLSVAINFSIYFIDSNYLIWGILSSLTILVVFSIYHFLGWKHDKKFSTIDNRLIKQSITVANFKNEFFPEIRKTVDKLDTQKKEIFVTEFKTKSPDIFVLYNEWIEMRNKNM